jgi:hypothetical protein
MTMAFEWDRMYKWEENHIRNITEDVEEYICEHYGITDILLITPKQYKEIEAFAEEYQFSIMRVGFNNVLNNWLNYHEEEGIDE